MYCDKGTNITRESVVNHPSMQLNDALIESYAGRNSSATEVHHSTILACSSSLLALVRGR